MKRDLTKEAYVTVTTKVIVWFHTKTMYSFLQEHMSMTSDIVQELVCKMEGDI